MSFLRLRSFHLSSALANVSIFRTSSLPFTFTGSSMVWGQCAFAAAALDGSRSIGTAPLGARYMT